MTGGSLRHLVPKTARGQRLDQHIAATFPELTRSRAQTLLHDGHIRLGGQLAKPSQRLKGGEEVEVSLPAPVATSLEPEDVPLTLLYEDDDLAVVDKPAGMVVHPGAGHTRGTLVHALLHRIRDLKGVGGELRPGIVHRLDKDTSGCLVVAKHGAALERLQGAFQRREVDKRYLALVHGEPPPQGEIETAYGRHPRHRQRFTGKLVRGKQARTGFRIRERFVGAALVEVALHTGRTHQVRVHLAELGHPLLADELYGGMKRGSPAVKVIQKALGRHALHAWRLEFPHPRTGKQLAFESRLPADLSAALEALRLLKRPRE